MVPYFAFRPYSRSLMRSVSSRDRRVAEMWFAARPSSRQNACRRHVRRAYAPDFRSRDTIDHAAPEVKRPESPRRRRYVYGRGLEPHQMASCFSDCISNDDEPIIGIIIVSIVVVTRQRGGSILCIQIQLYHSAIIQFRTFDSSPKHSKGWLTIHSISSPGKIKSKRKVA